MNTQGNRHLDQRSLFCSFSRVLAVVVHSSQPNSLASTTIPKKTTSLGESRRTSGGEDLLVADLGDTVGQREREILGQKLLDVRALDVVGLLELNDTENLDDLLVLISFASRCRRASFNKVSRGTYVDRPEASTVAGGQVLVHRLDSLASGHLTVLLVHVVSTRARVVTDPDAEVLDLQRVLLVDLHS